jgi:hypothetical protein
MDVLAPFARGFGKYKDHIGKYISFSMWNQDPKF